MDLHVGAPNPVNKGNFFNYLNTALDANWITNFGNLNQNLEKKIAHVLGVKHCICVCNATTGLQLLYQALDLSGEVIIPSFTFVATAHSLKFLNINPVFCDIDPYTHLIDSTKIEALITNKTTAILGVPIWGQPLNYKALETIAQKYKLKLIFDSAHAFGCKFGNKFIGGFGDAEVFSLHATKIFSSGEGGAITTNCDTLAEKLKYMRNFGFCQRDETNGLGINGKMSELSAAYGLSHLDDLELNISNNKRIYELYLDIFSKNENISFLNYNFDGQSNYQYIVARVINLKRDEIVNYYHRNKVYVRRYFFPGCHRMLPYKNDPRYRNVKLPNTEEVSKNIIVFPTGRQMNKESVQRLYKHFNDATK